MSVTAQRIRETAGPTNLVVGSVADGEFLKRVGSTIVGAAGGGAPSGAAGGDLGGTYPNPTVLSIANVTTGTLPVARGGTGLTAVGTAYQMLRTNAAANAIEWGEPNAGGFSIASNSGSLSGALASIAGIPSTANASTGNLSSAGSVDRLYAIPWIAPFTGTRTGVIWELTTGDGGKVVNWALYESDETLYPTDRIAAVSSVSVTTPAMKTNAFTSSVTVRKGRLYYLAWTTDSASAAQVRTFVNPSFSPLGFGTTAVNLNFTSGGGNGLTLFRISTAYAVPPSTFPTGAVLPGPAYPIVGLY